MTRALSPVILAGLLGAMCPPGAGAQDWPQFRGPGRDGIAPGVKLPADWPSALETRWRVAAGGGFSSPAVAGPRVFLLAQDGTEEAIRCLDAKTGKQIWRRGWRARFRSSYGGGPRATPTVDAERVYAAGGTGELYCLKVADGRVLWHRSFSKDFRFRTPIYGYSPSPLVQGDRLIVHVGGRAGHSVVALDKRTGRLIWKSQSDPPGYASPMIVPASESRGPRQLIVFTEKGLISVNPEDGKLYWRFGWTTSYEQNVAQPMLDGDLLVITTLTGCAALKLTQADGKPMVSQAWRNREMSAHFSCPVTWKGFLYGVHGRRPELRCLSLADGNVKWSHRLPTGQRAGIVLADERLLVYTDAGRLIVADASPEGYRERASLAVAGHNWVPPVLAAGCLFLRDERSLGCIVLPKP